MTRPARLALNAALNAIAVAALLAHAPVQAQKLAPGLWEHSMTMKSSDPRLAEGMARMQKELAAMPPEQRKQMEAMMSAQGMNMGMAAGAGGPAIVAKVCLTPEQAARDQMPPPAEGDCKQTSMQRSGNTLRMKFACTGKRPATGEGEYTLDGPKAHRGRTTINTQEGGKSVRMEMDHSGRWLASDCGAVQPRP
jgi:Protein of unknown function (DUF3617)